MNSCTGPSWPTTLGMRTQAATSSISAARFVSTCASTLRIISSIAPPSLPRVGAPRVYTDTGAVLRCRLNQAQVRQAHVTHPVLAGGLIPSFFCVCASRLALLSFGGPTVPYNLAPGRRRSYAHDDEAAPVPFVGRSRGRSDD